MRVEPVRDAFRLYRREKTFYVENNETGQQESLRTTDKVAARRLWHAKNEAARLGTLNLQIARTYMVAVDPELPVRNWGQVVNYIIEEKPAGPTRRRWEIAQKDQALDPLWKLRVVETRPEQLLGMLRKGTVSTNVFLRRLHNYALDMNWLPWPILPKKKWPKVVYEDKRGITLKEHEKIIAREGNPERRDYYDLCWLTGGSQSDVAHLRAEDINWKDRTIFYRRKKNGQDALVRFGEKTAEVLRRRPSVGPLFPYLITVSEKDRATEFRQRCEGLGIKGVTLHCYRYGWAERAAAAGYPERHAQNALGHGSKAVARAYAKKAKVKVPPLEEYEAAQQNAGDKVVQFPESHDTEAKQMELGFKAAE